MKNYHFIGISGIGMSALAHVLLDQDISVSGSDLTANFTALLDKGARCYGHHDGKNIPEDSVVVYSSAISENNEEYRTAVEKRYVVLHRSELLRDLMVNDKRLLVSGSHGKTTTTAMLIAVFKKAGKDPSFVLGSLYEGRNGGRGNGRIFIAEADESDGSIKHYSPDAAIVTNLDPSEHVGNYDNSDELIESMCKFMLLVQDPSLLFYCGDDLYLKSTQTLRGVSYGFSQDCALRILDWEQHEWGARCHLLFEDRIYRDIEIALPGRHNSLNAAAVFGLSLRFGITEEIIRETFRSFGILKRRLERRRDDISLILVDDYAHHPREIAVSLSALRSAVGNRRVIAVCQPHRYTRVRDVMQDYFTAFDDADIVVVTDIYSAGEQEIEGISSKLLVAELSKHFLGEVYYVPERDLTDFMKTILMQHDVCITLGAGDINRLHTELEEFNPKKIKVGLLFGGKSCEHAISVISARNIKVGLEQSDCYDISYIGINRKGEWFLKADDVLNDSLQDLVPDSGGLSFLSPSVMTHIESCDCFLPILHGPYSEDGRLQGFFEFIDKPYGGPDFRSATISMDKLLTKRLVQGVGVPVVPFLDFTYSQWLENKREVIDIILSSFPFPFFLKTVHLGSSVGIFLIKDENSLFESVQKAFKYDFHLFVEESKLGCKEIEFSFLGDFKSKFLIKAGPSERAGGGQFIDYNSKYGFEGQEGIVSLFDLDIAQEVIDKGFQLADKVYDGMNCFGCCRLDFFLDQNNNYWLSEVNPIPGMTSGSPFPKALEKMGIDIRKLCETLIIGGLRKHRVALRHSSVSTTL